MLSADRAGMFRAVVERRGAGHAHERHEVRDAGRQLRGARLAVLRRTTRIDGRLAWCYMPSEDACETFGPKC